jgi:multidrug efflux pump subunit AcrA (membrane-fusion protein)
MAQVAFQRQLQAQMQAQMRQQQAALQAQLRAAQAQAQAAALQAQQYQRAASLVGLPYPIPSPRRPRTGLAGRPSGGGRAAGVRGTGLGFGHGQASLSG